jgi:uncharacterized membrane protein
MSCDVIEVVSCFVIGTFAGALIPPEVIPVAQPVVQPQDRDGLAQALGWSSVGLGVAEVAVPRAMCRLVGATDTDASRWVMVGMGMGEMAQGVGVLTRPRPTAWLWARLVGDVLNLSLLGLVAARNKRNRGRTAIAMANVLALTASDVFKVIRLTQQRGQAQERKQVRKAVTIRRPRAEVEQAWQSARDLQRKVSEAGGTVSFAEAPGNRGTELVVQFTDTSPSGDLGAIAGKLTGKDLATQLGDDLRRFKQQVETGEIVRSDSTPAGHLLVAQLKQRPAQPLGDPAR